MVIFCFRLGNLKHGCKLSKFSFMACGLCTLRNFSLSCAVGFFYSNLYLLTDVDLHQTCLNSSGKKLIVRLSCQEFTRCFQCGCLREQIFLISRDWSFSEEENFSKRNYATAGSVERLFTYVTKYFCASTITQDLGKSNVQQMNCMPVKLSLQLLSSPALFPLEEYRGFKQRNKECSCACAFILHAV